MREYNGHCYARGHDEDVVGTRKRASELQEEEEEEKEPSKG